ncbi:MAG: EAL domain-containing protein, partial [Cycloclasticus sp.]|nr:EAL domain-containing protein [Cycloclasticus sp.]
EEQLKTSQEEFKSFFHDLDVAFLVSNEGGFVDCNMTAVKLLGYTDKKSVLGKTALQFSPQKQPNGDDSEVLIKRVFELAQAGVNQQFEWRFNHANGAPLDLDVSITTIVFGGQPMVHSTWRDITQNNKQKQALRDTQTRYKALFEDSVDPVYIFQGDTIYDCNDAGYKLLGFTNKEEVLKRSPNDLSPLMQPDGQSSIDKRGIMQGLAVEKGSCRFEWDFLHRNGQHIQTEAVLTAMTLDNTQLLHITVRDISEFKKQQKKLEHLAHYDNLTGLPNRVLFADRFTLAAAHSKRTQTHLAVCFLDIDNFKPINDNFGHDIGDLLLIEVAKRIKDSIREEDTVSRQGGDEFTLLLGGLKSYQECELLVGRMLKSLSKPYEIKGQLHGVTASCGITLYPDDSAADIDTLVRHADHAMYQAKLQGKNTFAFFDASTEKASHEHMAFIRRVSKAVKSNEMVLYYQPKVNMRTGHMFGAEALIRWQHPDKGLMGPFEFLPQIENTSAMIDIGNWVIEQALQQLEVWVKEDKDWVISINIDAHHFMQEGFYDRLEQALANHPNVPPQLLEIEILETVAFNDLQLVSTVILRCQTLGVSFALDDFGTGYSSLVYLKRLPTEWLKIDQSFVRDMLEDAEDLALIDGIVSLSKAFKRQVIAEGVETIEHGTALLKLGCINGQGYGIAKPMPADKLIDWEQHYEADEAWLSTEKVV